MNGRTIFTFCVPLIATMKKLNSSTCCCLCTNVADRSHVICIQVIWLCLL